jgi:diguanylate cyclase (GGDEF)-like protein
VSLAPSEADEVRVVNSTEHQETSNGHANGVAHQQHLPPETQPEDLSGQVEEVLHDWRAYVLQRVLLVAAIVILPSVLRMIAGALQNPAERVGAALLTANYLVIVLLALLRGLDVRVRAMGTLSAVFLTGVVALARGGLAGDGRLYLFAVPLMAVALINLKAGLWFTGLSLVTYVIFAVLAASGLSANWLIIPDNPLNLDQWLYTGSVMGTLLVATMVVLYNFYRFQMKTLHSEKAAVKALREANLQLEEARQTLEIRVLQRTNELAEANQRLQHLATHDSLTGLPNRALFHDRLVHAMAQARRTGHALAVLFVDLDDFKIVNDSFGHEKGDVLLRAVAERLTEAFRESDTIARVGGDEFTVILENLPPAPHPVWGRQAEQDAASLAVATILKKLHEVLDRPLMVEGMSFIVSASTGISIFPRDGQDVKTLLQKADAAMYLAKAAGKNAYQFYLEDTHVAGGDEAA